jgi:hypothetical protein
MSDYTLRAVDPHIWSRFTERANREGWPTKALFVNLMDAYGRGEITLAAPPPKQLPEWAWLRSHYREIARVDSFRDLSVDDQWDALVHRIVHHPSTGMSYPVLEAVTPANRGEILSWLQETSELKPRQILTLRAIAHVGEGLDLRTNRRAICYEVLGLPARQQAWIADFSGEGWQIHRVLDGKSEEWTKNPFVTKDEAVDALALTLDDDVD